VDPYYRPTRVEISFDALRHNIHAFREAIPDSIRIMAVVKGNAYGHGAVYIAAEAMACGADYLGVAFLDEAIELRRAGITAPVLVMGYTPPEGIPRAVDQDITLTVYSEDVLEALGQMPASAGKLKVHIKIDTGMSRLGLPDHDEAIQFIDRVLTLPNVTVEGLFTHYAKADELDKSFTKLQYTKLERLIEHYRQRDVVFPILHAGNSAAAIDTPEYCFNMIRLGVSMYGMYPSAEVNHQRVALQPVMRFVTRVVMLKKVPKETPISYGGIYTAQDEEWIATLPVGYADGYTRMLTGKAQVLIDGTRAPVVGRICMDQCMVNVTGLQVSPGDEVVLIGSQGDDSITADDLADQLETINYEITCMISNRVPKVYIRHGHLVDIVNQLLH
jgi:alanine racemase